MPRVTKAAPHPCPGIQAELRAYAYAHDQPSLRVYFPAVVSWGIDVAPPDKVAERLHAELRRANPEYRGTSDADLPRVDLVSTAHHGSTLFDWMWSDAAAQRTAAERERALARHVLRALTVLAHLRHEGCAHQDAACWNYCIDGMWIDFETAVFAGAPECRPHALPGVSQWPSFAMTVSGTDSVTLLLSVVEKGPPWAAASAFVNSCILAAVPPIAPGDRPRFHPAYLHAAERPLLTASEIANVARDLLPRRCTEPRQKQNRGGQSSSSPSPSPPLLASNGKSAA